MVYVYKVGEHSLESSFFKRMTIVYFLLNRLLNQLIFVSKMKWLKGQFMLLQILFTLSSNYCSKSDLLAISHFLKMSINDSEDSCTNFYKFACGNALKNNHGEEKYFADNAMDYTKIKFISYLKAILEKNTNERYNLKLQKERKFYRACIDTDRSVTESMELYMNILNEGIRIRSSWQHVATYYASKMGETFLFRLTLKHNNFLITRPLDLMLIKISYSEITLQLIDYFLKDNCNNVFHCPHYDIIKEGLYHFARKMHEIAHTADPRFKTVSIRHLQEMHNSNFHSLNVNHNLQINWLEILKVFATDSEVLLTPLDTIVVDEIYFMELSNILGRTPSTVIELYIILNFMFDENVNFYLHKTKTDIFKRSIDCINLMPMKEGLHKNLLTVKKIVDVKTDFKKLLDYLKEELKKEMQYSWMDDSLKRLTTEIINNDMVINILPIKNKNLKDGYIKHYYDIISYDFNVTGNAFQNYINFKKAQMVNYFQFYSTQVHAITHHAHGRNKRHISDVLKHDNIEKLNMALPLLFTPNFNLLAPLAYNLGRLGTLVANELSRVIYNKIVSPDYVADYLSNAHNRTSTKIQKTKCLIDQYNNHGINGLSTLKQHCADNLAIKVAFNTMKYIITNNLMSENLNSLPDFQGYTSEQLFFLSYANTHCKGKDHMFPSSIHFLSSTRVNIPLKNMKEFSEAFNCQAGESMNPIDKWDFLTNEDSDNM